MSAKEADVLAALARRFGTQTGNGPRFVFATHVRDEAGFFNTRTADAVAVDLWPSSGHEVHGIEVKVSRSDWLRELRAPEKAAPIRRFCHRWWLAVPDRALVGAEELPEGWGLMVQAKGSESMRAVVAAPLLTPDPLTPGFTASLLRAAVKTERARHGGPS